MAEKHGSKEKNRQIFLILAAILLLAFLAFILISEAVRAGTEVGLEKAKTVSVGESVEGKGYLFRAETLLTDSNNGPIRYLKQEGASVEAGDALADVYPDDSNTGKRETALLITREIELLKAVDTADPNWQKTYLTAYGELMQSLSHGALGSLWDCEQVLHGTMPLSVETAAKAEERAARIAELEAAFAELIKYVAEDAAHVSSPVGGRFCRETDGYEEVMTPAEALTLTPETLTALLSAPANTALHVGKVVKEEARYVALRVSPAEAALFREGNEYRVYFERAEASFSMTLCRLSLSADGSEAVLVFFAPALEGLDMGRTQWVQVEYRTLTGIRVPAAALTEENGQYTVFVKVGNQAEARSVSPILSRDGYFLGAIRSEEGYLQAGEDMVVTDRRIYDGKVLN